MKTKEELNALKEKEVETVNRKLHELTEEELEQVSGGGDGNFWSIESTEETHYKCYNPSCVHYGHYVSASAGPLTPDGKGVFYVCDFCGELITNSCGCPLPIDVAN